MPQYIFDCDDCVHIQPKPGVAILAMEAERMTLTIMEFEPNTVLPEHSQPHEQVGYMVEGVAEFIVDGQSFEVRPGQMWRLPSGVPHQVNVGGKFMRVVECFCPVREDFRGKEG